MNTVCRNCSYDIINYPETIELSGEHCSIYCPVCGFKIVELKEFPNQGIFYDDKSELPRLQGGASKKLKQIQLFG